MAYLRPRSILTRESDSIDAAVVNDEPLDNVESEGTLEVTDVIAAEEAEAEVADINQAIESENEVIEENQEVAEELEEVSEANETLIEQAPEQVTPEQVVAAEQAFVHAIGRARLNRKEMMEIRRGHTVSFESANASPLQALRVTQEGIKDFLRNLWDQIKTLIGKVIGAIQKLFQKVKLMFAGLEKKVKALKSFAKNNKTISISQDGLTELARTAPFFCYFKDVKSLIQGLKFASFPSIVQNLAGSAGKLSAGNFGIVQIITSLTGGFLAQSKQIDDVIATAVVIKAISDGANLDNNVVVAEAYKPGAPDQGWVYPFITDGKKLYVLVLSNGLDITDTENIREFRITVVTLDDTDIDISTLIDDALKTNGFVSGTFHLEGILNELERAAKDLDKVVASTRKSEDILKKLADSIINAVDKTDDDSTLKVDHKIIARTVQLMATKVSIASVNCYVNGIRNLINMCSVAIADYKKNNKSNPNGKSDRGKLTSNV